MPDLMRIDIAEKEVEPWKILKIRERGSVVSLNDRILLIPVNE